MSTQTGSARLEWSKVIFADDFWLRLRGLIGRPEDTGLLIRGRSVHGFWLSRSIRVYGIDARGVVISAQLLSRRRVVVAPGATSILEVPLHWPGLPIGSRIPLEMAP